MCRVGLRGHRRVDFAGGEEDGVAGEVHVDRVVGYEGGGGEDVGVCGRGGGGGGGEEGAHEGEEVVVDVGVGHFAGGEWRGWWRRVEGKVGLESVGVA